MYTERVKGLGGLSTALSIALSSNHQVTVYESTDELAEVGAGLQVTPNATRLLYKWGIGNRLQKVAAVPTYISVTRYDGSKRLSYQADFQEDVVAKFNAPFWDLHRADLQTALYERTLELGVKFRLGCSVTDVNFDSGILTLKTGEKIQSDLIVGADGLWSTCRQLFTSGIPDPPVSTGDLAYRIVLSLDQIADSDLRDIVQNPGCRFW